VHILFLDEDSQINSTHIKGRAKVTAYDWGLRQMKIDQRQAPVARGGPDPTNALRKVIGVIGVSIVSILPSVTVGGYEEKPGKMTTLALLDQKQTPNEA